MNKFPALAPLEDIAMDLIGEFIKTTLGNKWLLVIVDRFSKLVRTLPLASTKTYDMAKAFTTHWVFSYRPPVSVLTDNGLQLSARFMLETIRILGIKELFLRPTDPRITGILNTWTKRCVRPLGSPWANIYAIGICTPTSSHTSTTRNARNQRPWHHLS